MPPKNGIAAGILFLQKGGFQGKTCKNLPKGKASEDCWWLLFLGSEKKKLCSKRCLLLTQYLQLHKIFQLVCRRWLFVEISLWILKHRNFHPHVFFLYRNVDSPSKQSVVERKLVVHRPKCSSENLGGAKTLVFERDERNPYPVLGIARSRW